MRIEPIRVSRINPAPYNPRLDLQPGDPEYEKLARSIDEFGCVEPLVWNKRTRHLVGGHQRFKVLLARGATEVDVSVVDLPLEREKALNIALNKIAGDWDQDKLARLLDELVHIPNFDVSLTGFETADAAALIAGILHEGEDQREETFDVEAAMAETGPAVTTPGDLIVLGKDPRLQHRLLCGDSTDPAQVKRVMDGQRAILFATDPPYRVGYTGLNHPARKGALAPRAGRALRAASTVRRAGKNKDWRGSYGVTPTSWDDPEANPDLYEKFIRVAVGHAVRPDAAWYCWHASKRQAMVEEAWAKAGAFVHQQIVWAKDRPILTYSWYTWQHEPCFFGWVQPNKPPRRVKDFPSTVWHIPTVSPGHATEHPTSKPVELFAIPMRQHTRAGEVCYEPFAGSGSQIIAAQKLGRRCFAVEISPTYCDVIVRRYIAFAGEDAVSSAIARKYRRSAIRVTGAGRADVASAHAPTRDGA